MLPGEQVHQPPDAAPLGPTAVFLPRLPSSWAALAGEELSGELQLDHACSMQNPPVHSHALALPIYLLRAFSELCGLRLFLPIPFPPSLSPHRWHTTSCASFHLPVPAFSPSLLAFTCTVLKQSLAFLVLSW